MSHRPSAESHVGDDIDQNEDSGNEQSHEEITPEGNGVRWDGSRAVGDEQSQTREEEGENEELSGDVISMFNHCSTFVSVVGEML